MIYWKLEVGSEIHLSKIRHSRGSTQQTQRYHKNVFKILWKKHEDIFRRHK